MEIKPGDLKIDTLWHGSNWSPKATGVRIEHIPSGIYAEAKEDRSQYRNRDIAYNQLLEKLKSWDGNVKPPEIESLRTQVAELKAENVSFTLERKMRQMAERSNLELTRQLAEVKDKIAELQEQVDLQIPAGVMAQQMKLIAELKAENERDKEGVVCGDCDGSGWLENRVDGRHPCTCMTEAEPYQLLEEERDELKVQLAEYKGLLSNLMEVVEEPPERNCSCHISPPCSDCVEWSGLREALSEARTAMKGATE